MKKNTFYLLLIVSVCLFITSCTSVIQVSVPTGAPLVTVDAFLDNSSSPQKVRLTFNANYFSNVSTPPVLGATVSLNDLTNAKTYTFIPDGNGNYIYYPFINDSMAQVNHKYQLNISYNGNSYIALSTLNRTIPVSRIVFCNNGFNATDTIPNGDTTKPRKFYPYVFAFDSIGIKHDFYWLKVFKNGVFYNQPDQMDIFEDAGYGRNQDYLIPPFAFRGLTSDDNRLFRNDICTVEIYSIDKNTLDFLNQLKTQLTNSQAGLFAVTPQNVKTNIQQTSGTQPAVGWFNIGAISSKSVVAK